MLFYFLYFRSDSSQDILLANYISIIKDTPSDFDWGNIPKFANFNKVTVGSLVNLYRLDQKDIVRLVEKIAPPNQSALTIDKNAKGIDNR